MGILWLATLFVSVLALASMYQTIIRERKRKIGYLRDPEVILADEPTNDLDAGWTDVCNRR